MMNTCSRCGMELFGYNDDCPGCGYSLKRRSVSEHAAPPDTLATPSQPNIPAEASLHTNTLAKQERSIGNFLTLRWMLGPAIIRLAYWIGLFIGSAFAIGLPFQDMERTTHPMISPLTSLTLPNIPQEPNSLLTNIAYAVLNLVIFNVVWRLLCEGWILLYDIRNQLVTIVQVSAKK